MAEVSEWIISAQEAAASVDGKLEMIGAGGLTDTAFHGVDHVGIRGEVRALAW